MWRGEKKEAEIDLCVSYGSEERNWKRQTDGQEVIQVDKLPHGEGPVGWRGAERHRDAEKFVPGRELNLSLPVASV